MLAMQNGLNNSFNGSANSAATIGTSPSFSYGSTLNNMISNANAMNLASARETNEFNAREAEKNRQWQSYYIENAHKIEMDDLIRSGLNPVLSAMNGNGANVTSGATAHGEKANVESGVGAFASILGAMINQQTELNIANINAETQREYFKTLSENALLSSTTSSSNQDKYVGLLEKQLENNKNQFGISTALNSAYNIAKFGALYGIGNKVSKGGAKVPGLLLKMLGINSGVKAVKSQPYQDSEGNWWVD